MKIIFLDIDGVLNSHAWFARPSREAGTLGRLDPSAVARVQGICAETGASVVITSSLRLLHTQKELVGFLRERGFAGRILGATPHIADRQGRGDEIQRWLDAMRRHGRESLDGMVIFDDEEAMFHLESWCVRTSYTTGLTDDDVALAKRILLRAMPPSP
jgi:hypothetical protein